MTDPSGPSDRRPSWAARGLLGAALVALAVGALVFFSLLESGSAPGIQLPIARGGEIDRSQQLSEDDIIELADAFLELKRDRILVLSKPDTVVTIHADDGEALEYSIWLENGGFLYVGHFLKAWDRRVRDQQAEIFRLDEATVGLLQRLKTRDTP